MKEKMKRKNKEKEKFPLGGRAADCVDCGGRGRGPSRFDSYEC